MSDKVDFDEYVTNYNQLLSESTSFFSANEEYFAQYKVEIVRSRLRKFAAAHPVKQLLEFGCGIGRNIAFLQRAFPAAAVAGTDISEASLVLARQHNPGVEFAKELGDLPVDQRFDLIFVAGVFHHIAPAERPEVARQLRDRLQRNGQLFVFEHNPYNPITRKIVNDCPYDADAILLSMGELQKVLHAGGLVSENKGYCLFIPPKLRRLAVMEPMLGWLPLGGQYWVQAGRPG